MVKIYCYAYAVWEYVIDSLGVSEDSTYGSWWLGTFSLVGVSFCFAVGVCWALLTVHLWWVHVCRWTRVDT